MPTELRASKDHSRATESGILVLRPGALGDALLALPALRALRRGFPGERLALASHPSAARLLASAGEVDLAIGFDEPSIGLLLAGHALPEAPWAHPRRVVGWLSSADEDVARALGASGADVLVGPSRPSEAGDVHCSVHLLRSLAPWGVPDWLDDRPLRVVPESTDAVLVHPGSGSPRKNWPPERFAAVIRELLRARPVRLIAGEADDDAVRSVLGALEEPVPLLRAPLDELASALAGCHAYVGNDSGVSHLAGLVGARTVAMFGPTRPTVWRPLGSRVQCFGFDAAPDEVAAALV